MFFGLFCTIWRVEQRQRACIQLSQDQRGLKKSTAALQKQKAALTQAMQWGKDSSGRFVIDPAHAREVVCCYYVCFGLRKYKK